MNKGIARLAALSVTGLALVAVATPAHAFRMIQNTSVGRVSAGAAVACNASGGFTHWNNKSITWFLNSSGAPGGAAGALTAALGSWNTASDLHLNEYTLTNGGSTSAGFVTDGQNAIVFARGNGCNGQCLAITALVLQAGQVIVETDVSFSSRYNWQTTGGDLDFQAVCTHEVGHSLGIHHTELTSTPRPTMYAAYFGVTGQSLEADDRNAMNCTEDRY
ncbi:MAG TPA: matrixin family metalloprotease [Candidatus Polarisedimenticolaceae bacterium]|nr:matrixin family metalloprotease [Candidatus Polarisedimenticolaceae bacterium]